MTSTPFSILREYPLSKFVLVTGASSGIGAAIVRLLDKEGFHVLAGVRKNSDAERIRSEYSDRVVPLNIDVTIPTTIAAAREQVGELVKQHGLVGLVNNAGIVVSGPLESLPISRIREQFEVNVFGQFAVTQAFMDLLKTNKDGRIINLSSVSGLLALPTLGPYAGSKFALEAMSDSLRMELRKSGVKVVLIEPGVVSTPIWERSVSSEDDEWRKNLTDQESQRYLRMMSSVLGLKDIGKPASADQVARVIHKALTARKPKPRYQVGWDVRSATLFLRPLPTWLRDWLIQLALKRGAKRNRPTN
jgi:NAD(P)-dependent dehydrogenase (short-subunit alcohol dehydrogenase family)